MERKRQEVRGKMWWILLRKLRWVYTRSIPRRQSPSIFARCFNFNKKGIGKGEKPPVDNMRTSPERKEKKKRHGNSVTTTGFESSRKDPRMRVCVCFVKENTASPHARTSWKGRSKQDWNFACQEEYASPVLVKVTQHEAARRKLSAKFVRSHIRPPSIASLLMIKHPGNRQSHEQLREL